MVIDFAAHNPGHMLMESIEAIALHQARVRCLPAVSNWDGDSSSKFVPATLAAEAPIPLQD